MNTLIRIVKENNKNIVLRACQKQDFELPTK